jgi:hypothetical protein
MGVLLRTAPVLVSRRTTMAVVRCCEGEYTAYRTASGPGASAVTWPPRENTSGAGPTEDGDAPGSVVVLEG